MAIYKDFSKYQINDKEIENVVNIGWLGEKDSFIKGGTSYEFLVKLWEYYKCPVLLTRKIYQNKSLDGDGNSFVAMGKGRSVQLGSFEIRVLDEAEKTVYAAPSLLIHYIVNHHYLPPIEFINAVINGPKPDSKAYCKMIRDTYRDLPKKEGQNGHCPFCHSKSAHFAYKEKIVKPSELKIIVGNSSMMDKLKKDYSEYFYFFLCQECGHLYQYDLASIM